MFRPSQDPARAVGLFLAKLFAYLVRLQTSDQTIVPHDIAYMVGSAEDMVHGCIRMRASAQLKTAGYTFASEAMRAPGGSAQSTSVAGSLVRTCSRANSLRTEGVQGCATISTEDLIDRLTTTIETFERADELADQLARMIVCALAFAFPQTREPLAFARSANDLCRVGFSPPTITPVGQGPPYTWPPPFLDPGAPPGTAGGIRLSPSSSFPGARRRIRDPEKKLEKRMSSDDPRPDLGSIPPALKHLISRRRGYPFSRVLAKQ